MPYVVGAAGEPGRRASSMRAGPPDERRSASRAPTQPDGLRHRAGPGGGRRRSTRRAIVTLCGLDRAAEDDGAGRASATASTDAVAALTDAQLEPNIVDINSRRSRRTGHRRRTRAGKKVAGGHRRCGSTSPRARSRSRAGRASAQPYEQARAVSSRRPASRSRARTSTRSSRPSVVVGQDPSVGETAARGSTVTLSVSKGPSAPSSVPDVTSQDEAIGDRRSSQDAGFKVASAATQDHDRPGQDGSSSTRIPPAAREGEAGLDGDDRRRPLHGRPRPRP